MAEAKPFASLSSGLLARKGAAKPAMRPQGFGQMGMGLEDLGWNDMGHAGPAQANGFAHRAPEPLPEHQPSSIAALTPAPRQAAPAPVVVEPAEPVVAEVAAPAHPEPAPPPPVVEQQRAVEAAFAPVAKARPVNGKPAKRASAAVPRSAAGSKSKSAFTLRLDPDRHLRLRLACAFRHRSAQQLVTEALDAFLADQPELDALTTHVPASGKTN